MAEFDHTGEAERVRTADLLRLVPKNRQSVLDIGARDGYLTRLLTQHFSAVVALDLEKPAFTAPGVVTRAGDVTKLDMPSESFDVVFCAEVLEHVPNLARACAEIGRVARHEILIGVPYRQDTRMGRVTCQSCRGVSPPWGHVNTFDENAAGWLRLIGDGWTIAEVSRAGPRRHYRTNFVSTILMDLAGNPWGSYNQAETCPHCNAHLVPPPEQRSLASRLCSGVADALNVVQFKTQTPREAWLHILFRRAT